MFKTLTTNASIHNELTHVEATGAHGSTLQRRSGTIKSVPHASAHTLATHLIKLTLSLSVVFGVWQPASALNVPTQEPLIDAPSYTFFGTSRYIFDTKQADGIRYNDAATLTAGLEKSWLPHWGTELRYFYAEPQVHHGERARFNQLDLSALFYVLPAKSQGWQPYFSLGVGAARLDSDDNFIATVGTGVRWHLTNKLALKADYRLNHALDEDQNDQVITIGVSAVFGSKKTNTLGNTHKKPTTDIMAPTIEEKSLAKDINLLITTLQY